MYLYYTLAKIYNCKWYNIEKDIRYTIEITFEKYIKPDVIDDIFGCGYSSQKGKLTNSEFLFTIIEYVKYHKYI